MTRVLQFALGVALIATTASPANAQHRRHAGGTFTSSSNVQQLIQGYPAPGLGFDYTHHAAVNRNFATRALVDPITQHQLAQALAIRRDATVVSGGFPVLVGGGTTVIIIQQPPPTIVVQGSGGSSGSDEDDLEQRIARLERASYSNRLERLERLERGEASRENGGPSAERPSPQSKSAPEPSAARPARYEAPRETSEIVFIRRDGSLIFAVAFTKQRERIVYISSEGQRRVLPLAELDVEATVQMNEARGAEIRF